MLGGCGGRVGTDRRPQQGRRRGRWRRWRSAACNCAHERVAAARGKCSEMVWIRARVRVRGRVRVGVRVRIRIRVRDGVRVRVRVRVGVGVRARATWGAG